MDCADRRTFRHGTKKGLTTGQIVLYKASMLTDPNKISIVDALAEKHGVSKEARRKWRERGVPSRWQIRFVNERPDALAFSDFAPAQSESSGAAA